MKVIIGTEVRKLETLVEFDAWAGGARVLEDAIKMGILEELDELCKIVFDGECIDETELNDWLWHDSQVDDLVYGYNPCQIY